MNKIKGLWKAKSWGFYIVVLALLLALFTLVVNGAFYTKSFMSPTAIGLLITVIVVDVILILLGQDRFVPAFSAILSGIALGFYIDACYLYVSTVMTGIDVTEFSLTWILTTIGFAGTFIVFIATVFMPITKNKQIA